MPKHHLQVEFNCIEVKGEVAADLLLDLHAEHFDGPVTTQVREQLWLYGWFNLLARLRDGKIAELGKGPGAREVTDLHLDQFALQEVRDELAVRTLEGAVPKYLEVLQNGRYDPYAGTTVATYFAGYAFRRFRTTIHPRWANDQAARRYELGRVPLEEEWYSADLVTPDHADQVAGYLDAYRAAIRALKQVATVDQRAVIRGVLSGRTHLEIAADLQITPKAVERRLATFRRKAWIFRPDGPPIPDDDGPDDHELSFFDWDWAA